MEMKEKNNKRASQTNEKTTQNPALQLEFHQRNKLLNSPPVKFKGSFLRWTRTLENGPEKKKANENA